VRLFSKRACVVQYCNGLFPTVVYTNMWDTQENTREVVVSLPLQKILDILTTKDKRIIDRKTMHIEVSLFMHRSVPLCTLQFDVDF
jgi:hypothetical protein